MLLKDRAAIVTGGAVGIGRGIALKFASEGCSVAVADIDAEKGNRTANEITSMGIKGIFVHCDVTDSTQVNNLVKTAIETFGKVDIIVNNAGGVPKVTPGGTILDISDEQWELFINLNLRSTFYCCRAVVAHMMQNKYGKIINISSIGAVQPSDSVIHYHAAKGGVVGLTTNLAFDLAPYNINVNSIMPGPIVTPFWDNVLKNVPDREGFFRELAKKNVPMGRVGTPEDIAGAALYLASELSSYVTGQVIKVAGGIPLLPKEDQDERRAQMK